jgi:regulator of sigma E protease
MSILIFIIILLVLVVSHEFGHFIVAKKSGIRVDEFSFGFPPKLFGKKIGETTYNFNLLPLGGYVKIFGEDGETEETKLSGVGLPDVSSGAFREDKTIVKETLIEETIKETISSSGEVTITETETIKEEIREPASAQGFGEAREKSENKSRSFADKPKYIQAMVLFAGIAMNFLVAWLLLSIGFMSGLPTSVESVPKGAVVENQALTITSVLPKSPAEIAGIKTGDKIISLDAGKDTTKILSSFLSAENVQTFVKAHNGENITVEIIRGKEPIQLNVIPEISKGSGTAMIGISMDTIGTLKLPIHKAIWEGLKLTWDVTVGTVVGFYHLIHDAFLGHADLSTLTGPVGIVGVVGDAAKFGFIYLLSFTAFISINLAVINLIPFPALDGGRLLFLLIEKIKGSRIKPEVANWVNTIGFGLLMILMVFITYHDIVKLL